MRHFKSYCLFIIFALLLVGCSDEAKEKTPSNTKLTLESYSVTEKEKSLIQKTGVEQIEYFELNGTLKEEDDLQFSIDVYENGKFKEELLKTQGATETNFKDILISFGVANTKRDGQEQSFKLLSGIPLGLTSTNYSNDMTAFTFGKLLDKKITLVKDKPIYLAAWLGTTKDMLLTVGEVNGELPEAVEDYELAFLYKVLWTDKE